MQHWFWLNIHTHLLQCTTPSSTSPTTVRFPAPVNTAFCCLFAPPHAVSLPLHSLCTPPPYSLTQHPPHAASKKAARQATAKRVDCFAVLIVYHTAAVAPAAKCSVPLRRPLALPFHSSTRREKHPQSSSIHKDKDSTTHRAGHDGRQIGMPRCVTDSGMVPSQFAHQIAADDVVHCSNAILSCSFRAKSV